MSEQNILLAKIYINLKVLKGAAENRDFLKVRNSLEKIQQSLKLISVSYSDKRRKELLLLLEKACVNIRTYLASSKFEDIAYEVRFVEEIPKIMQLYGIEFDKKVERFQNKRSRIGGPAVGVE